MFDKLHPMYKEAYRNYPRTEYRNELMMDEEVSALFAYVSQIKDLTNDMVEYLNDFAEKFDGKLYKTVEDVLNEWIENNKFYDLFHDHVLKDVWGQIDTMSGQISTINTILPDKVNKNGNEEVTLRMLSQEVKEMMAGGSLPVVAEDSVNTSNIVDGAVTDVKIKDKSVKYIKTNFIHHDSTLNMFDGIYERKYLNGNTGGLSISLNPKGKFKTFKVEPNTTYRVKINRVVLFKYGTSKEKLETGALDGAVSISSTSNSTTINTGPEDNWLYISLTNPSTDNFTDEQVFLKVVKTQLEVNIADGEGYPLVLDDNVAIGIPITPDNVTFLKQENKNLFDGVFINKYLSGSEPNLRLQQTSGYGTFIIEARPNTTYTIQKKETQPEDGYYYFKIATSTRTKEQLMNETTTIDLDGSFQWSRTSEDVIRRTFTTGANDISIIVTVGKTNRPYTEALQGTYNEFQYESYEGSILPNGISIYSKKEVDSLVSGSISDNKNGIYVNKSSANQMMIYTPQTSNRYIGYKYERQVTPSLNLDVWRATDIYICDATFNNLHSITTGDNEGVIKVDGEVDYIGGWHGDEIGLETHFYLNGCEVNVNSVFNGWYDDLEILVRSNIFHAETSEVAFEKIKNVVYSKEKTFIHNQWSAKKAMKIAHVRGGILSIIKKSGSETLINSYRDNLNIMPRTVPDGEGGSMPSSDKIDNISFYGGLVYANVESKLRDSQNVRGSITNFGTRLKIYLDSYINEDVISGQVLTEKHEFKIKTT